MNHLYKNLSQPYKHVDDEHVMKGLTKLLKKSIKLLSYNPSDSGSAEMKTYECLQSDICIHVGHIKDEHFMSLKMLTSAIHSTYMQPARPKTSEMKSNTKKRKSQPTIDQLFGKRKVTETNSNGQRLESQFPSHISQSSSQHTDNVEVIAPAPQAPALSEKSSS